MGAQTQRPRFFEGQYLTAGDLSTVVDYLRAGEARHALGAHTWGIALGLTVTEKSAPGADHCVEATLQPGLAWDGYGRIVMNSRPTRLREELFADIPYHPALDDVDAGGQGRLVPVWLAYDETASGNPAPGFETCATDDQAARIGETFRFEIGKRSAAEQRGRVAVGTTTMDAADALSKFDSEEGTLWDASVPHQQFPSGKPPRWLIPIGYVRWIARDQELGYFAERDLNADDRADDRSRAFRRYIGTVAEYIQAADGAIVLHRRDDKPELAHRFANLMKTGSTSELLKDLVWVEGNLRVVGDEKIAGGELHFRNADGEDEKTPLYLSRTGDNPVSGDAGLRSLRVIIGPSSQDDNRLVVGPEDTTTTPSTVSPHLVVVSSGHVGVGTSDPATSLEVVGDWNGGEGAIRVTGDQPAIRFEGGEPTEKTVWAAHVTDDPAGNLRLAYQDDEEAWQGVLHVTPQGRVGVGAPEPTHPLGVRASGDEEQLVSFEDGSGVTKWQIDHKANGTSGLNIAETGVTESVLFLEPGGKVGINTQEPDGQLTVADAGSRGSFTVFGPSVDVEYDGGADGLFVFRNLSDGVTTFEQTKLGVGTRTPRSPLSVRASGSSEDLLSFEQPDGTREWHINQAPSGQRGLNIAETGVANGRLFIREGGDVGIGTTDPHAKLHVAGQTLLVDGALVDTSHPDLGHIQAYLGGDAASRDVELGSTNSNVETVTLWNTAGHKMDLGCRNIVCHAINTDAVASATVEGDTITASDVLIVGALLGLLSDESLKRDITPVRDALATVGRLRGVQFRWKEGPRADRPELGVIAQEVAQVLPHLVTESKRGAAVSYLGLIPVLIEAVKELKAQVETLRADVDTLTAAAGGGTKPTPGGRAPKTAK